MTKYEAIFRRKSVRRYKEEEIPEEILEKIRHYGAHAVGIRKEVRIKWKVYRASDHNVKGMFQVKAPYYAALYSEVCEDCRIPCGMSDGAVGALAAYDGDCELLSGRCTS